MVEVRPYVVVTARQPSRSASTRGRDTHRSYLPAPPTALIGRERELDAVAARLRGDGVRLLTLTGPPGTGKTRLALATATALAGEFADGAVFVPLAPVSDPGLVVSAVATALGLREGGERPLMDMVCSYLQPRELLLALDNFEHLLAAVPLVADMLASCPLLTLLVTSRAALRVRGEREFAVPPLALPDTAPASQEGDRNDLHREVAASPAVQLFVERARDVHGGFELTHANAPVIAAVCTRLDGLPLAIELAAARLKLLSPEALLARLNHRLDVLTGGPRDLPARQQTLRAAVAWSYDLLAGEEQALLRRMSVFAGGCTLDAAMAVSGAGTPDAGLDLITSLMDNSLVLRQDSTVGETRFTMLETLREYGAERLQAAGEADAVRRQHAKFYLALAEQTEPELKGPRQLECLSRVAAEHDNLRAALRWSLDQGETELALRLAGSLEWFWHLGSHYTEGRRWLADVLAMHGTDRFPAARARALYAAGSLARFHGDNLAAGPLLEESAAHYRSLGDTRGLAYATHWLGRIYFARDEQHPAETLTAESIPLFREVADPWGLAMALATHGGAAARRHDPDTKAILDECVALSRQCGDRWLLARSLNFAGQFAAVEQDHRRAASLLEESLALSHELGHKRFISSMSTALGAILLQLGDVQRAGALIRDGLLAGQDIGNQVGGASVLAGCAQLAVARGEHALAVRLLGAADAVRRATSDFWGIVRPVDVEQCRQRARTALGDTAFGVAYATGRALSLDDAIIEALVWMTATDSTTALSPTVTQESMPDGLTARETQVLRLLAGGNSNQDTADALVLSPRTVERHIASIYRKIGARNRADATAYALRHGLIPS